MARIVRKEHLILSTLREYKLNYKDQFFFKMLTEKKRKKMFKSSTLLTDNNLSTNYIICLVQLTRGRVSLNQLKDSLGLTNSIVVRERNEAAAEIYPLQTTKLKKKHQTALPFV